MVFQRSRQRVQGTDRPQTPFYRSASAVNRTVLPNVLLMVADDLQPADLGNQATQRIDAIGADGVTFANAHTPSPLCTPSRYAILTGLYASFHFRPQAAAAAAPLTEDGSRPLIRQIGVDGASTLSPDLQPIEFNINLPLRASSRPAGSSARSGGAAQGSPDRCSTRTLATHLAARGYATGIMGKCELCTRARGSPHHRAHRRRAVAHSALACLWRTRMGRICTRCICMAATHSHAVAHAPLLTLLVHTPWRCATGHLGYPAQTVSTAERKRISASAASDWRSVKEVVLREYRAVQEHVRRCGFDVAERLYVNNLYAEQHVLPSRMLHHNIEWVVDGATRFITAPRRSPFFLYVGFTLPHNPDALTSLQADPRYTPGGMWAANRSHVQVVRAAVCRAAGVSAAVALDGGGGERASRSHVPMAGNLPPLPRFGHRHYPLALAWLDSGVGAIMAALRRARVDAHTLSIFTSDHAAYDKGHCYTGGSRIPLLLRWPGMLPMRPLAPLPHLVSHLDLLPTILDAADAALPVEALQLSHDGAGGAVATAPSTAPLAVMLHASSSPPPAVKPQMEVTERGGRSLARLLLASAGGAVHSESASGRASTKVSEGAHGVYEAAWQHGSPHARTLFCEVGQARAVFTSRYRLIYAPRIKPLTKGGTTNTRNNYQVHRHHAAYWRPLQMYDLLTDAAEQRNLVNSAERAALNMSATELQALKRELSLLQGLLLEHLNASMVPPA